MLEKEYGIEKAEYRRGLEQTMLIFEGETAYIEDYQMKMLEENHIKGFLDVRGRGQDGTSLYEYDITGKRSIKSIYEERKITIREMKKFTKKVLALLREASRYLLDADRIVLDPEFIFCENGEYAFCYYPLGGWDVWKAFHKLTEHFVQWTDYQDDNSVKCAFLLHKETMRENYSLRKILKKLEEDEEEKKTVILRHTEQEPAEYSYDTKEHDWITSQEMGSSILRETDNMWNPVKNFLKRHKKPAWKAWDGIYIDEEEL